MLIRQTLQYLPAQIVGPLSQFVAVLAWTHWLPPSDYGFISLMLAVQELAFLICMSWWTHYTVRYLPGLPERGAYRRSEPAVMTLTALAQAPIALVALALTDHLTDLPLVAATLAFIVSRTATTQLGDRARALGDILTYSAVQIAGPVLGLGLGFALLAFWPGATAVIGGFAIVQVALLPFLAQQLGLRGPLSGRLDLSVARSALVYGGPLLAAGGLGWVSMNGIRLVVEHQGGLALLGLLSVGWNLGQRLIGVVAALVTAAAYPLAVRQAAESGAAAGVAQISRTAIMLTGLLLPAMVGLIAVSGPLTRAFVGAEFQEATLIVLPLAALAAGLRNLRMHLADQVFMIVERPTFLLALNAAEAAATVALCMIGLAWGGLAGACVGCVAATAIGVAICFCVAILRHGMAIPLGAIARIAAATGLMALALRLDIYPDSAWGLAAQVAAGGAVYCAAAAVLLRGMLPRLARSAS